MVHNKWPVLWLPWIHNKKETRFFQSIKMSLSSNLCIWVFANWNTSQNWNWHVPPFASSHVCLYLKHILANCVFHTVFPNIVDQFEPVFWTLFQCFLPLKLSLLDFPSLWKSFLFLVDEFGNRWGTLSSWFLLRESTKLTNWELPKLNKTTWFYIVVGFAFSSQPCQTI